MDKKNISIQDVRETRIALAFYGGVALAVYESGVAVEFFRLVKGEGPYRRLRERIGRVVVDIITGTSAGGLNGAVLANALVNRGDIMKLLPLWTKEGDIDQLLYGLLKSSPRSLLDGDRFLQKIFEALLSKRAAPVEEEALQPALELYITATNIDGDRRPVRNPDGDEIPTRSHRQVFRFQFQAPARENDVRARNDFGSEEDLCLLAAAARATAAFPFAFEPVLVKKQGLGRRALFLEADSYHIDGGVLDNKPIALAVSAIAGRTADKQVDRLLFFIEPDPERIDSRVCQASPKIYGPIEIVLRALISLPGYQSITSALQELERHNREVRERRRVLDYYERGAWRFQAESCKGDMKHVKSEAEPTFHFIEPRSGVEMLFRSLEDGYLDLRLERDLSPRIRDAILAVAGEAGEEERSSLYALKSLLLESLDLSFPRRLYRYMVQRVRDLYPSRPSGTGDGTGADWRFYMEVTDRINLLKDFLYRQEELVRSQAEHEALAQSGALERLEAELRGVAEALKARRLEARPGKPDLLEDVIQRFRQTETFRTRIAFVRQVKSAVLLRLTNEINELIALFPEDSSSEQRERIEQGYWILRDALEHFYMRDMVLYPMMQTEEVAAEMLEIKFARISPADADQFMPGLDTREKLAGEKFAHFAGFLDESWRGNDLTWGRLDAAEIILRKLWPGPKDGDEIKALISEAQEEIIREMAQWGMGINTSSDPRDREHLIGRQSMSSLPLSKKIEWALRACLNIAKILRRSIAESRAAAFLKDAITVLNWITNSLTVAVFVAVIAFRYVFRWPVIRWIAAILAIMAVGILLWERSLQGWWDWIFR